MMLRFLYILCDWIAGVLAITSPIAVFHWLAKLTDIKQIQPYANMLDPIFGPLNQLFSVFIQAPVLHYNGQTIPTTQGIVAAIMTLGFFIFNICSEYLKATEQRLDVATQAFTQRRRLQQLKSEQKNLQQQMTGNRKIYVYVQYGFRECPSGSSYFETSYTRLGGKIHENTAQNLVMEFESLEKAFQFSLSATQGILNYYTTLRPIDPQPDFNIAIQGIEANLSVNEAFVLIRKLVSFAGKNQIIFGPEVNALMREHNLNGRYHFQSVGVYSLEGRQSELFRLFYEKRDHSAF